MTKVIRIDKSLFVRPQPKKNIPDGLEVRYLKDGKEASLFINLQRGVPEYFLPDGILIKNLLGVYVGGEEIRTGWK